MPTLKYLSRDMLVVLLEVFGLLSKAGQTFALAWVFDVSGQLRGLFSSALNLISKRENPGVSKAYEEFPDFQITRKTFKKINSQPLDWVPMTPSAGWNVVA